MIWTRLPTDYTDAIWNGNRKYNMITNSDGTVSFEDVTEYTNKENSFFGATEANQMNTAMNELAENIDSVAENAESAANSASTATAKATAAANSASAAASSQRSAENSASSASTSATTATNKATAAANSATSAEESATAAQESAEQAATLLYTGAGAHNAIYRGKFLGNSVTSAQYAAISAGTFTDMYIGDYWTINNVNYRIAAFDYYLNCGDTSCTKHHVVLVPDTCLYTAQMHNTSSGAYESGATANTTAGGYVGSDMYKTNLAQAKTTIKAAFSGHVLSHRVYLTNAVSDGHPSAGAWCDSEVELMNEQMVYGGSIFMPHANGSTVYTNYRVEKSQLPLFAHEPSRICNRATYWLRDVVSASRFALVTSDGLAHYHYASTANGVRPAFCIS